MPATLTPDALPRARRDRRDRHRARVLPRPPGSSHGQAGDRALLRGGAARRRRRGRGVQLPHRPRRRHDAAPRVRVRQLGAGLRRLPLHPGPRDVAPDPVVGGHRAGAVRPRRRGDRRARWRSRPDAILRRQIERAAAMGFHVKIGAELEFFLFENSYRDARGAATTASSRRTRTSSRTTTSSRRPATSTSSARSATASTPRGSPSSSPRARPGAVSTRSTSSTPTRWRWRIATRSTRTAPRRSRR